MPLSLSTSRRVLLLGASGMLGHALLRELSTHAGLEVYGTARSVGSFHGKMPTALLDRVRFGVDALDPGSVRAALDEVRPNIVVNCVGVIKQAPTVEDAEITIRLNALLPHLLADWCGTHGARLVQVSTDCVFSGRRGRYTEADLPDPSDFYGRSKLLGETTAPGALTLRTSIVGHELGSALSLIDWFLSQRGDVRGFTRAIYTGLTTVEVARLLATVVFPDPDLGGLYHVASSAISKYDLLGLVAVEYGWGGRLVPYDDFACDRSLMADTFTERTGYVAPSWPAMVRDARAARTAWGLDS